MTHLATDKLLKVGKEAAGLSKAAAAELVSVTTSYDPSGEVAHFFEFKTAVIQKPQDAVVTRLELAHAVRDRLIDLGDEAYPYVRLTGSLHVPSTVDDQL